MKHLHTTLVFAALAMPALAEQSSVVVFNDKALRSTFEQKMGELVSQSEPTTQEVLIEHLWNIALL